jgi:hypothetical protein
MGGSARHMSDKLAGQMPANPAYGDGYFVRSTVFHRLADNRLEAVLEDPFHALALVIQHDEMAIVAVEARWERHPLTSCAGADLALSGLAGLPLINDLRLRWPQTQPGLQCTHMFDSLRLAAVHAALRRPDRRYEVVIPDTHEATQPIRLVRDGTDIAEIAIDADFTILSPSRFAGAPLLNGFARWAGEKLSAEEYEQMFLIQRGAFVGRGQKMDITQFYGEPGVLSGPAEATCFASQPERYPGSLRLANARPGLRKEDAARFPFA